MSKSAARVEEEISLRVETRRLRARGLWWTLRRLVEQNGGKYPGDVRTPEGAAIPAEVIGHKANTSAAAVLSCLHQLEAVKLAKVLPDGTIHCPHLARLQEIRVSGRNRWRKCVTKEGGVLANTQKGVRWGAANTQQAPRPPPPLTLSPTTPIPLPPQPPCAGSARGKKGGTAAPDVPIPEPLAASPGFVEAWGRWRQYRRELRKPLTPTGEASQLRQFVAWGVPRAVAAIDHTIMRGWQGIREPDQAPHQSGGARNGQKPEGDWASQRYVPLGPAGR